ncbi:MAG: FAD-dependent oxidoreductase [Deltaproteobacteria bacterium]|nr:FAD-dependent oxidoreductase [Deltaproteobacteria bacterium]
MTVLSIGQRPPKGHEHILRLLDLRENEWGFCQTHRFSPVETSRKGIYVCGPFSGPRDIPDTICQATAAASGVVNLLESTSDKKDEAQVDVTRDEIVNLVDEEPNIAIFICKCGGEISSIIDIKSLAQSLKLIPEVKVVEEVPYLCQADTLSEIKEQLRELKTNRVIFASCVPYGYERKYQQVVREAGLNPSLMEIVNLREQVAWVHKEEKEEAQKKALGLVRATVEKLRRQEPLSSTRVPIKHQKVLIIGGGLAGLVSSLSLSRLGVEVCLVEQSNELGGNLREKKYNLEGDEPQVLLKQLLEEIKKNDLIQIHLENTVIDIIGQMGDFTATIVSKSGEKETIAHGAIIVATGGRERKPQEYHYGESDRIITQKELEKKKEPTDRDCHPLSGYHDLWI